MIDRMAVPTLHLFTTSGKTFTFHGIEWFSSNESVLTFRYKAGSDGLVKEGTFYVANLAGFSVAVES
jgi:hypothetical protein